MMVPDPRPTFRIFVAMLACAAALLASGPVPAAEDTSDLLPYVAVVVIEDATGGVLRLIPVKQVANLDECVSAGVGALAAHADEVAENLTEDKILRVFCLKVSGKPAFELRNPVSKDETSKKGLDPYQAQKHRTPS